MTADKSSLCSLCGEIDSAVCNGDQLLNFSIPELFRSQSTFSTDPEVLQNCAGFTLCSSAGVAVSECSAVMDLTPLWWPRTAIVKFSEDVNS